MLSRTRTLNTLPRTLPSPERQTFWTLALVSNANVRARYMAPEVAKSLASNQTVDAYSFAMVIWEMIALEKPFHFYNSEGIWEQLSAHTENKIDFFLSLFLSHFF